MVVGVLVAWANPARRLNRAFLAFSVSVSAWLLCQWRAGFGDDRLWWVRMACAVAVGVVLMMWLVKQTAAEPDRGLLRHLRSALPWAVAGAWLIWICFTPYFVPEASTGERRLYGWGYLAYLGGVGAMILGILVQAVLQARRLTGVRRLELQLLLLGSIAAAGAVITLMVLGALTGNSAFNRAQSVLVLAFYTGTSWAIVTTRVLDGRYILALGVASSLLVALTALVGWSIYALAGLYFSEVVAILIAVAGGLSFSSYIQPKLRRTVGLSRSDAEWRSAAFQAARRESRPDKLEEAFMKVLKGWSKSERAIVLTGGKEGFLGSAVELTGDNPALHALRQLRWASPERLARERSSAERDALKNFLRDQELGLAIVSDGPALTVLIGVGVSASRRPFTHPQVTELQELGSIIESAMERAHYAVKVQHAEQLATVGLLGASLAHEIRNPLVSIKTFVHLLPKHHHDPVFRQKFFGLIGDEVTRIDRLTEQLLDLASPRVYKAEPIDLHPVLRTSLELVAAKATDKRIEFLTDFQANPDRAFTDGSAAKQVLLNLCFNAIQAVETQPEGPRWVKVATRNVAKGIEMMVEDSGPGISPAIRPRLFQPFQSTKSSGFGLGLAICSDILAGLDATISVDPSVPGRGALFRIVFPCPT